MSATKVSMNRRPLLDSDIFGHRGTKVKWPTIRKAWLTDKNVAAIRKYATGKGRSIVFLDGEYQTTLNRYKNLDPTERAVFFEFMVRNKETKGAIFTYVWIGNFHNGSIIHFGFQYPQVRCWEEAGISESFFERATFSIYRDIVNMLYEDSEHEMDREVRKFIECGEFNENYIVPLEEQAKTLYKSG